MSTRATIRIAKREEGVSFNEHTEDYHTQIYHHYDGYPEFLGVALAEFFDGFQVTNGNGPKRSANGLGCLSAQLLTHLKLGKHYNKYEMGPGNVYIDKNDGERRGDCDYEYYVWAAEGKSIWISIFDYNECIFVGEPSNLIDRFKESPEITGIPNGDNMSDTDDRDYVDYA